MVSLERLPEWARRRTRQELPVIRSAHEAHPTRAFVGNNLSVVGIEELPKGVEREVRAKRSLEKDSACIEVGRHQKCR